MQASKVKVVADELNNVVRLSANPDYGYILVEQTVPVFKGKFMSNDRRTAIINGTVKDLKTIDLKPGQELDGKIYVIESLEPTNPENHEQDVKYAGNTGVPCTVEGQPIYRTAFYTTSEPAIDYLIPHDNKVQIQESQKAIKEKEVVF